MKLLTLAIAGALLWAGAGPAWASDCERTVTHYGYQPAGTSITIQYGSGARRGHWRGHHGHSAHRGHGWGWGGGGWYSWHAPVRRYTQVVVPACPPAQVVAPVYSDTLVINVRNSNGSYTPVTLRREGGTYIGPRGERYLSVPTEEQLKAVYGLE